MSQPPLARHRRPGVLALLVAACLAPALGLTDPVSAAVSDSPLRFDFNDGNSFTQTGYIGVAPTAYSPTAGFGWDTAPSARSRWASAHLNLFRDGHHASGDRTFMVDVPAGEYTVHLSFFGDLLAPGDNDDLQVFAEGRLALEVEALPRDPFMTRVLRTEVADGRLDLRFHDAGGLGTSWCISGLNLSAGAGFPQIERLSTGTASAGDLVAVTGAGFGSRATATPVIWEDFEAGTAGASLATGGWSVGTSANLPPVYSNELAYGGNLAGMADFPVGTVTQSTCCAYKSGLSLDEVYVSYHVFIRRNSGVQTRNLKLLRVHSGAIDFLHGDPNIGMTNQNDGGQIYASGETNWSGYVSEGTWHRVELYAKLSSVDQYDGAWEGWIDQRPIAHQDRSMLAKSSYPTNRFRFVALPIYCAHDDGGDYDVFYDDVHVDSSRARVELGNHPDWDQCTRRELQLTTGWDSTVVGFRVRPGSFTAGDRVYVFVVDAAGNASEGVPLTLAAPAPRSFTEWRTANFSGPDLADETVSGADADPDGAGVTNFLRYAFDLPARGPISLPVIGGTVDDGGQRYLTLTFPRRAIATDLSYQVQTSTDLATWTTVASYGPGDTSPFIHRDTVAFSAATRRFLRLRAITP